MVNFTGFYDVFSWEKLSYVLGVFALLTSTAIVPVYQLAKKRAEKAAEQKRKEHTELMEKTAVEVVKPLIDKLEQERQERLKIRETQLEILSSLKELCKDIQDHSKTQKEVQQKVYFIEGYLQKFNDKEK